MTTSAARISGTIGYPDGGVTRSPLVLVVYRPHPSRPTIDIEDYRVYLSPGPFSILLTEGTHRLAVFEDADFNLTYNAGERFGLWEAPVAGGAEAGDQDGITLIARPTDDAKLPDGLRLDDFESHLLLRSHRNPIRIIDSLADAGFASGQGQVGTWRPETFAELGTSGLFCLGTPNPRRTPVVFVHGANGTPLDWQVAIKELDRSEYQAWVYSYPTALSLSNIGWALHTQLNEARVRYRLKPFTVAAHSMGGLVGRAAFQWMSEGGRTPAADRFITAATPFGGHPSAVSGARWTNGMVHYWRDLAPGSDFLKEMYARPLPASVDHYMIVSNGGFPSLFVDMPNDGAVPVASQMAAAAVQGAKQLETVKAGHVAVIQKPLGLAVFGKFLMTDRR